MSDTSQVWVLGHRIRCLETDAAYGMIEAVSSPGVPGPPPHHHANESEFFLVIDGRLDFMIDGQWRSCGPGEFLEIPPGTVHTFINNSDRDVIWVTGWRPKGFERFFRDFGIPVSESDAQARSVEPSLLERVGRIGADYGMIMVAPEPPADD